MHRVQRRLAGVPLWAKTSQKGGLASVNHLTVYPNLQPQTRRFSDVEPETAARVKESVTERSEDQAQRLLDICGDLESARGELKWLREGAVQHVENAGTVDASKISKEATENFITTTIEDFVSRRASGEPLQYILGTEFFGDIELECRKGVLIPRWETASIVTYLAHILATARRGCKDFPQELKVLDLCSGSGCIPLQFQHTFHNTNGNDGKSPGANTLLRMIGIDASETAVQLATENKAFVQEAERDAYKAWVAKNRNTRQQKQQAQGVVSLARYRSTLCTQFQVGDVFSKEGLVYAVGKALTKSGLSKEVVTSPQFDVLISNPPYVSPEEFETVTEKSVREHEPRRALVPEEEEGGKSMIGGESVPREDRFYPRLLQIADEMDAKVVLFEVSGEAQAKRVIEYVRSRNWEGQDLIWRDLPEAMELGTVETGKGSVQVLGKGNVRAVFALRGEGQKWLKDLIGEDVRRRFEHEAKQRDKSS